nr:hypothetical protein [Tanacetum cinerariifolium]
LRVELDETQKVIDKDPSCQLARDEHDHYLLDFKQTSRIEMVSDSSNVLYEGNVMASAFVSHYEYKIRDAIFSMGDDKAHGPDSFSAAFLRRHRMWWEVLLLVLSVISSLTDGLGDLVSINQSAFVLGPRILDNILLTRELIQNYHRRSGRPRCAFKVDN